MRYHLPSLGEDAMHALKTPADSQLLELHTGPQDAVSGRGVRCTVEAERLVEETRSTSFGPNSTI